MAFTAVEDTRIAEEIAIALIQSCPTVRQVFLDGSGTYANNLTDFNVIVAAVTAVLFDSTAPTISP